MPLGGVMKPVDPLAGWYSAQDLAGLPGMHQTDSAVMRMAKKNLWVSRRKPRGKGLEYPLTALPEVTRAYLLSLAINAAPAALPAPTAAPAPAVPPPPPKPAREIPAGAVVVYGQVRKQKAEGQLTDADCVIRDASLLLCRAVEAAMAATDCSLRRGCEELAARLIAGDVRPELLAAAQATYVKPRPPAAQALSPDNSPVSGREKIHLGSAAAQAKRLYRMMGFFEQGRRIGDVSLFLTPGKREKEGHDPVHIAAFLRFYCRPTRPPVAEAYREMAPFLTGRGLSVPSYSTVLKIEQSLPVTIKYRGRITGSEWRGLKPYIERDVSMFHANDIWVGDGHSFKAKVAHPIHGQPYTPEITMILDWVSRKIVGWSVALSESTIAVSDAFRHAQRQTRARPLVYYSDNGSGQTGKMIDHPIAGTLARQGIRHETGIPGNPQGRGIIERLWQVTLIPLARTYPTCTWRGADENTTNQMLKSLNKADFGGVALPAFLPFIADVDACIQHYNLHHSHRELDGKTPEDEYQERIDKNSIVFGPNEDEINALWMPEVIRKPQRGRVSLFGNVYCKADLVDLLPEGARVRVRYDLHQADKVKLYTIEGMYLGEADWDSHRQAAFPVPEMERQRALRAARKEKRGEKIIAEAQAELGNVLDLTPAIAAPIPQPSFMESGVDPDQKENEVLLPFADMVRMFYHAPMPDDEEDREKGDFKEASR